MNLNKAMIIGNLTRDPEVRTTPSGQTVATFGIATNLVWTDADGQKQQKVEFHNVVAWRKLGEICGTWLKKGKQIYLEGRLQTRDWVGQDGVRKYRTEIVAENMIMLGSTGGSGAPQAGTGPAMASNSPAPVAPSVEAIPTIDQEVPSNIMPNEPEVANYPTEADDEDEVKVDSIPF